MWVFFCCFFLRFKKVLSEFHQFCSQLTFGHLTVRLKLTGIYKKKKHPPSSQSSAFCVFASQHACPCMCRRSSKSAESLGGCGTLLLKGCLHGDRCGSSPWRWIGADAGRQGRGPRTRREWLQPPRQEIEEKHFEGGELVKKGAISQAKLLLGWRREKYHSNNSTGDVRTRKQWEEAEVAERRREGGPKQKLNYQSHQTCMLR